MANNSIDDGHDCDDKGGDDNGKMNEWIDGWMDRRMDGWMDRRMDGWKNG